MQKLLIKALLGIVVWVQGCVWVEEFDASEFISQPSVPQPSAPIIVSSPASLSELEQSVYQRINDYRISQNLPPLKLDLRVSEQARIHSQGMATGQVPFSHDGAQGRFRAIAQFIRYRQIGENVAYNSGYVDPVKQAIKGWLESPGHKENIEGNYNITGVGVARNPQGQYYLTQIFVRSRP